MWYCSHLMTGIQRHFLGWDTPFLPASAKWLQENYLQGEFGSSKRVLILVSGRAVSRRLQTHFVNEANKTGRAIELPTIVTPSQFFRECIPHTVRIADQHSVLLETISVLKQVAPCKLQTLIGARPIKDDDFVAWLQVARKVWETIKTASGGGISMKTSSWPKEAFGKLTPDVIERFALLEEIKLKVEETLSDVGTETFEKLQLQLVHPEFELNLSRFQTIIVVGCSDLSLGAISLLQRILSENITVESLIRAPESEDEGFDEYGRLVAAYWMEKNIDIENKNIVVAGSPSSQSAEVVRELSLLEDTASADEITIVATDEKLIPILQRHIRGHDVNSRYAGGFSTIQTPEALLVSSIADFISSQSYMSYAALVRHPDVTKIAKVDEQTLKQLGDYSSQVVPSRIHEGKWFFPKKSRCSFDLLEPLHAQFFEFFKQYIALDQKPTSIKKCSLSIRQLLLNIYGDEELDRTSMRLKALQKFFSILDSFDGIPESISQALGTVRISEVLRFMLHELENDAIPELPDPLAIETVGWLEGMVVDTPYVIAVGMSSELGGGNNPSDAYFPDSLLDALGLETIERRMARDTHAVIAMQQSRIKHGSVSWIIGRKNTDADPLSPSPLMMRCKSSTELATRAGRLVVSFDNEKPKVPPQFSKEKLGNGIQIPKPSDCAFKPLKKLRVTGFKDYLACSYRFWLKHVLKLEVAEDGNTELDAKLFGSFVHSVLQRFGEDEKMKRVSDVTTIEKVVYAALEDVAIEQLGSSLSSKIEIQLELARVRLKEFAKHQAKSVDEWSTIGCAGRFVPKEIDVHGRRFGV
ncbi:PD-(D/E)XK nuclease family protein, partial [bacterium]|nr:PD-(D/E)XK nuclease family protein [bacterium]